MSDLVKRLKIMGFVMQPCAEAAAHIEAQDERIKALEAGLSWYREQARLCRLIHSEGDQGRHALADDGGKRAASLLDEQGK